MPCGKLHDAAFLWQFPHFMASRGFTAKTMIAPVIWFCRRGKARVPLMMLETLSYPVFEPT